MSFGLFPAVGDFGHAHGPRHDQLRLLLELDPVADLWAGGHDLGDDGPEIGDRGLAQEEVSLGLHLLHAGDELLGLEPQVQRGDGDADAVAGVDRVTVLLQERQTCGCQGDASFIGFLLG